MSVREYLDCFVFSCDRCGQEFATTRECSRAMARSEHFCENHFPGCADCGADLLNETRHTAPDLTPEGQDTWHRCQACHKASPTMPSPPPGTVDDQLDELGRVG